jgi:hypothetical protein
LPNCPNSASLGLSFGSISARVSCLPVFYFQDASFPVHGRPQQKTPSVSMALWRHPLGNKPLNDMSCQASLASVASTPTTRSPRPLLSRLELPSPWPPSTKDTFSFNGYLAPDLTSSSSTACLVKLVLLQSRQTPTTRFTGCCCFTQGLFHFGF